MQISPDCRQIQWVASQQTQVSASSEWWPQQKPKHLCIIEQPLNHPLPSHRSLIGNTSFAKTGVYRKTSKIWLKMFGLGGSSEWLPVKLFHWCWIHWFSKMSRLFIWLEFTTGINIYLSSKISLQTIKPVKFCEFT